MATENRRVAAYLPSEIDECLKSFKIERGLASEENLNANDSKALILILSEYFEVSQVAHPVTHYVTIEQFNDLSAKVEKLYGLLQQSDDRIEEAASEIKSELLSELKDSSSISTHPGQLSFLQAEQGIQVEEEKVSQSSLPGELLCGLPAIKLGARLGFDRKRLSKMKFDKGFTEFCRNKDPDGIGWEYREDKRKFFPVETSDQVNPLPEGSERSGEG